MAEASELFATLHGEPMNAVSFVMDYVEFHFNGQVLRALSNPTLKTASGPIEFPDAGSRDALCRLITDTVTRVEVVEDIEVTVGFASGAHLSIPLETKRRRGPEALHFMNDGRFVVIWWWPAA